MVGSMVSDTARTVGGIVGAVIALLLLVGLLAYATDYGMGATIVDKGRDSQGTFVVAETAIGGIKITRHVSGLQATAVQEGNYLIYHIRSGCMELYNREGGSRIYTTC